MTLLIGLLVVVITVTTVQGSCEDKQPNCAMYGKSACTKYPQWAQDNCAKYCDKCGGSVSKDKCTYNGKQHADGSNWIEGCKARCQCKLSKGEFPIMCNALCWDYQIPSSCHWNPPKPGKCCRTPNCPPGVSVDYPKGRDYWGEDVDMKIMPW